MYPISYNLLSTAPNCRLTLILFKLLNDLIQFSLTNIFSLPTKTHPNYYYFFKTIYRLHYLNITKKIINSVNLII